MWLLWKKLIAYIILLGTASYFGIELLPAQQSKTGTAAEQSWNDQVAAALGSGSGADEGGGASAKPVLPTQAPTPATPAPAVSATAASPQAASTEAASTQGASPGPTSAASQAAESPAKARMSINHATWQELTALPGIGETKAKAIVDYRDRHGGFRTIDELQAVKGIGPRTVDKLRAQIML